MRGRRNISRASSRPTPSAPTDIFPMRSISTAKVFTIPRRTGCASRDELAAIAARIPPAGPVVNYCNTGHWSSTDWFVLSELLGRKNVKLYYGSMVEWSSVAEPPGDVVAHQMGRHQEILWPRDLMQTLNVWSRHLKATIMTAATSSAPAISAPARTGRLSPRPLLAIALADRACADRRPTAVRHYPAAWLRARRCILEIRIQFHRVVAALSHARRGRRLAGDPDADRDAGDRRRAGRDKLAELWRIDRADRPFAGRRRLRVRDRHAAWRTAAAPARSTPSAAAPAACWSRLALFIVGSVLGSLCLPTFLRFGGIDPVLAGDYFGPWGGLAVTLASIALVALVVIVDRAATRWLDSAVNSPF